MAKKSFKGGLGSLLESTFHRAGLEKPGEASPEAESSELLRQQIELLSAELALWRQGQLDVPLFEQTLREANLRYVPEHNRIEKNE